MKKVSSSQGQQSREPATQGERLLFCVWLAGKVLGVESAKEFAEAIDKDPQQLSKWIGGKPRPSWESLKAIGDAVRVSASWLDDPKRTDSVEPAEFAEWFGARRERQRLKQSAKRSSGARS